MKKVVLTVQEENKNERLDKFISDNTDDISRSYAARLADEGLIRLSDGRRLEKKYKLKGFEIIEVDIPEPESLEIVPEDILLDIVYEDKDLIVINKPQGMVVHPAAGNFSGTLVNALLFHCKDELSAINGVVRPGIVHRLDKDTSGLLVAAKNNDAHLKLSAQLKERKAVRRYIALVNGNIKEDNGTIDKPIARHPSDRKKMAIVSGGREAVTHFTVLERFGEYTLVECVLETGRTHQIRVHMASIGHSIVGDKTYGIKKEKFNLQGQLLHARTIGFVHPRTGEYMEFCSEVPEYFANVLNKLKKD
ncbi:MAG: RluA family pseudouridine synthase [Clostridia bacterium]|nr:RluA family pseudouridine synthase [Clostridia bacterium]